MVISSKGVFTRKSHQCWGCGKKFEKGTNMMVVTNVGDGIHSTYWCEVCDDFWKTNMQDFEDGISCGDFAGEELYIKFKKEGYG